MDQEIRNLRSQIEGSQGNIARLSIILTNRGLHFDNMERKLVAILRGQEKICLTLSQHTRDLEGICLTLSQHTRDLVSLKNSVTSSAQEFNSFGDAQYRITEQIQKLRIEMQISNEVGNQSQRDMNSKIGGMEAKIGGMEANITEILRRLS